MFALVEEQLVRDYGADYKLTKWSLLRLVFLGVLRRHTFTIVFCLLLDCVGKCLTSVVMSWLIVAMAQGRYSAAYVHGTVLAGISFIALIGRHNN